MAKAWPGGRHFSKIPKDERMDWLIMHNKTGHYRINNFEITRKNFDVYKAKARLHISDHVCYVCDANPEEWHHVVHVSRGGANHPKNIVPLCRSCHKKAHRHDKVRGNRKKNKELVRPIDSKPLGVVFVPKVSL